MKAKIILVPENPCDGS